MPKSKKQLTLFNESNMSLNRVHVKPNNKIRTNT